MMAKAKIHVKTETEGGPLEFRVQIPDSHPIVSALITHFVETARPDRSQLKLFEERPCSVPGCDNPAGDDSGLCLAHEPDPAAADDPYENADDPDRDPENVPPACTVEGCGLPGTKKTGMCRKHNKENREGKALEAAKENAPKAAAAAEAAGNEPETAVVCAWEGCDLPITENSQWCREHHRCEVDNVCRVPSCSSEPYAHGLCEEHHCSNPACENVAGPAGVCFQCGK
jgi:hypothetical protein